MPTIIFIPKKDCRVFDKWQYILPRKIHRKYALGICIFNNETKETIIYIAKGNGLLGITTLFHELLHYVNFRFFNDNKRFNNIIESCI